MLVNIHFQMDQKWPSQIRDHLLFMPGRGGGGGEVAGKKEGGSSKNLEMRGGGSLKIGI